MNRLTVLLIPALLMLNPGAARADEPPAAAPPTPQVASPAMPPAPASPEAERIKKLGEEQSALKAEFELRSEQLKHELADLLLEKQRLDTEMSLDDVRRKKAGAEEAARAEALANAAKIAEAELKVALSEMRAEKERLAMEMDLREERNKAAAIEVREEIARIKLAMEKSGAVREQELEEMQARQKALALANQLKAEESKTQLAELAAQTERLTAELALIQKQNEQKVQELTAQIALLAAGNSLADQEQRKRENEHKAAMTDLQHRLAEVQAEITLRDTRETYRNAVNRDIEYRQAPFEDGVLTISDRRIPLNDVIMEGTADFVSERINYFNNQSSEDPIFIVIDRSPGGSVMEGYRIIKAMEASRAPIHVVVKSFAASMAACIATVAEHSYAYPNAILLHHQPSGAAWGNLTQQDEQIKIFKEWARRLHTPVAEKMGVSLAEFYKMMYEKNSEGDWQEFADGALKVHWIDHIADAVREEGITKKPADEPPAPNWFFFSKSEPPPDPKSDFVLLPRLKPFDCYFIHNPEGYYRWIQ